MQSFNIEKPRALSTFFSIMSSRVSLQLPFTETELNPCTCLKAVDIKTTRRIRLGECMIYFVGFSSNKSDRTERGDSCDVAVPCVGRDVDGLSRERSMIPWHA